MITLNEISKQVAKELNMNPLLVDRIARMQYIYLRDMMAKGKDESVILMHLGKFLLKTDLHYRMIEDTNFIAKLQTEKDDKF